MNLLLGMFFFESIDQVQFSAYRPLGTAGAARTVSMILLVEPEISAISFTS